MIHSPPSQDIRLRNIENFLNQGKIQEATSLAITLAEELKTPEVSNLLARIALVVKNTTPDQAIQLLQIAIKITPDSANLWLNLSLLFFLKKNRAESVKSALAVLDKKPSPQQLVEVGKHFADLGDDKRAIDCVKKGYLDSKESLTLASYTLRVALKVSDWQLSESIINRLQESYDLNKSFEAFETPRTHLLWCDNEEINIRVISQFARRNYPENKSIFKHSSKELKRNKIRIGYLSSDFRDHATSLLFLGALRHHNREEFEIYGYCTSFDDGSAMRRDVISRFHIAKTLSKLNDQAAAQVIFNDQIDILIDLNGLTEGSRPGILSFRPANIQISYLGFPGTAGGRFIDYIIADDYTLPVEKEHFYPEKIIRIPPTYQINDYRARYLPPPPKRDTLNLPKDLLVIGMFNNINKVHPLVWKTWLEILNRFPKSVLWVLDPGEVSKQNLLSYTEKSKFNITKDRIIFAPKLKQEAHLARLFYCDIILDPWPYGGHTTTGDALFAGIPVIALEGKNFASRVSGGLLLAANLSNLVASDVNQYIDIAIKLLSDAGLRQKIKHHLTKNRIHLDVFDSVFRTLQIEAAYKFIHEAKLLNKSPKNLRVFGKAGQKN